MISLSFLNLLGVDIIQLFGVGSQWASSVRGHRPGSLLGAAESCTPKCRDPRSSTDGRERRRRGRRSEPRTRLTRALAPYSRDPAAVGDAAGSPGLAAGEARRAGELQRASGRGRLPAHPTRGPATSSTAAGRTRGSRRRSAPLLATRTGRVGQGQPARAGAATLPSCSAARSGAQGSRPGWGCCCRSSVGTHGCYCPGQGRGFTIPKRVPGGRREGGLCAVRTRPGRSPGGV